MKSQKNELDKLIEEEILADKKVQEAKTEKSELLAMFMQKQSVDRQLNTKKYQHDSRLLNLKLRKSFSRDLIKVNELKSDKDKDNFNLNSDVNVILNGDSMFSSFVGTTGSNADQFGYNSLNLSNIFP